MHDSIVHTTVYDFRNSLTAIAMSLYLAEKSADETEMWERLARIQGELEYMTRRLEALETQMSEEIVSHDPSLFLQRNLTNVEILSFL